MDEREGARRELAQHARHGIDLSRQNADVNTRMAMAYEARQAGAAAIPADLLERYATTLREEAASCVRLAEAMEPEVRARG